jgi:glyoxylase-like metal-dependent hydrolase (beta-lactamase superfamily II)
MTRKGSGVREIVLLTLGWEHLPKSVSVEGAPAGERIVCPVPGILLLCDGGWLLLDTGFNTALIRDAALRRRFYGHPTYSVVLPGPGEPLEEALAFAGIAMEDVKAVGLSHLHLDHAGGLRHFTGVPVHCQRRELEYGLSGHPDPEQHAIYRIDFDDPGHDWRLADGDVEIAPGVTAISTPGHTPGHQSFVVDLDESVGGGGFVFAFDAADVTENIEDEVSVGGRIDATPEEAVEQIRRLKKLAAERGYPLVPGHDPVVWPELTRDLAGRFPARVAG